MKLKQRINAAVKAFKTGAIELPKQNVKVYDFPELDNGERKGNIFESFHVPKERENELDKVIKLSITKSRTVMDAVSIASESCNNANELVCVSYIIMNMAQPKNPLDILMSNLFNK